jgi:hypothetical protein
MSYTKCNLALHCVQRHKETEPTSYLKIQVLETADRDEDLAQLEEKWRWKLCTWQRYGSSLNTRSD